jgi:osmotically-inducible protein OsmY
MKNDLQLQSDVEAELAWDPGVNASGIAVSVSEGVVRLSGVVETCLQKRAAEGAVHRVSGARGSHGAAGAAAPRPAAQRRGNCEGPRCTRWDWHSLVPEDSVKVRVENGWVTLTGEVDWSYQSASAEQCIHPLLGVRGVSNAIGCAAGGSRAAARRDRWPPSRAGAARRDAVTIASTGSVVTSAAG